MPLIAPIARIRAIAKNLRGLASPGFRARLGSELASTTRGLVDTCFEHGRDPYGTPWLPTVDGGKPLDRSGQLRGSIDVHSQGLELVMHSGHPGATLMNFGGTVVAKYARALAFKIGGRSVFAKSVTVPARSFWPGRGMPSDWRKQLFGTAKRVVVNQVWKGGS